MSPDRGMDAPFQAKYQLEKDALARLASLEPKKLGAGAVANLKLLERLFARGVERIVRARRSVDGQEEVRQLVREFLLFGAKAILLTGPQRGGDFLSNQLRGQWAERVALSMPVAGWHWTAFGPSGAAMPGEGDHREVIMTFKEIHLLEGKRPDLLAFEQSVWLGLTPAERERAITWPKRRLEIADDEIIRKAGCGIEVKNSVWHYGKRRASGGGPLSVTVKDEEVADIRNWTLRTERPVLFVQVLFDELYCMSFRRIDAAIRRGSLYEAGDYEVDQTKKKNAVKVYHKFHLRDRRHFCGRVRFPDKSTAQVRVLEDGYVVPFIDFQPAEAYDLIPDVLFNEMAYVAPVSPPPPPPTPAP